MQQKIVITGAPGTGKTSVIKMLEKSGYICLHEVIRDMTLEAKKGLTQEKLISNPLAFVSDPLAFNKEILKGRVNQYKDSMEFDSSPVFFDRGIPDVLAYMDFFGQTYDEHFINACKTNNYTAVFLLPPWKEIYISDNERLESFEEAIEIHHHLEDTYTRFGYQPISVPFGIVKERLDFILNQVNLLG